MVAGHMTKKNGYWYLILMVRDETGPVKAEVDFNPPSGGGK